MSLIGPIKGSPSRVTGRKQACRVSTGLRISTGDSSAQMCSLSIAPGSGTTSAGLAFAGNTADVSRAVASREHLGRHRADSVTQLEEKRLRRHGAAGIEHDAMPLKAEYPRERQPPG